MHTLRRTVQLAAVAALLAVLPVSLLAQGADGFRALSGQQAAAFTMPGDMELVKTIDLPKFGLTYERYQQVFGDQGAQVLGAQITLYRDSAGNVTTVIGAHYGNITASNAVGLSTAGVHGIVNRDVGPDGERNVDLMIDPDNGRYFYRVETRRMDSRWFHWIDAENGQVLNRYDGIMTGDGTGVQGDTKSMLGITASHSGSGHGASDDHYDLFSSDNRQFTYDYENKDPFLYYVWDEDDTWNLAGTDSPGQPALVDAQYYANVTDDYFFARFGLDWKADCYSDGMQSVAHYNKNYNNAFWNGTYTVYGDGSLFRELSGALDIVAHEHTHGVTDCFGGLIYQDESGALNESFSDMLGNGAEFYADTNSLDTAVTPDWTIGEDIYVPEANGFRNMADPEANGDPDHYSELTGSGVHTDSGIPNHAFYLLVNGGQNASCLSTSDHDHAHCSGDGNLSVTAIAHADAEEIFFLGFDALTQNATMEDARGATEAAAETLFDAASQQLQSVTDAWGVVGVGVSATPECTVDADCDDGSLCTTNSCDSGTCSDAPVVCDDEDACTVDSCDTVTGCGVDGEITCDDGLECSPDDSCDAGTGCTFNTLNCDLGFPGDSCDLDAECLSNKCKGKPDAKICK